MNFIWRTVLCLILLTPVVTFAADVDWPQLGKDSIYFTKYKQAGLDQYNRFATILTHSPKPVYSEIISFNAQKPELPPVSGEHYYESVKVELPDLNNPQCFKPDYNTTLASQTTKDYYKFTRHGTDYTVRMEDTYCFGDIYNHDQKTLRAEYDGDSYSVLNVYLNGIRRLTIPNGGRYGFSGDELIVSVSEGCCNLGSFFNRYNWVNAELLGEELLEISLDDVPSSDAASLAPLKAAAAPPVQKMKPKTKPKGPRS